MKKASVINTLGIIAGIIIFIFGMLVPIINHASSSNATSLSSTSFGGDFYTYAYKGIRETDKTLNEIENDIEDAEKIMGNVISVLGILLIFICAGNIERYMQLQSIIEAVNNGNMPNIGQTAAQQDTTSEDNELPPM